MDPGRPSGRSPKRFLCIGFWSVKPIAVCMSRDHGAVSSFRACGLPYGLRGALCTLHLCRSAVYLLHRCNTRYRWWVRPSLAGTCTLQETPSFAWRTNAGAHLLPKAGAQRTLEAVRCSAWFGADPDTDTGPTPQPSRLKRKGEDKSFFAFQPFGREYLFSAGCEKIRTRLF